MEKQLTIIFMQTKCDWGWLEGVRTFHDVPHPDWIPFEHLGFHGGHVVWSGHASNGLCHIKSPCQYCLMRKLLMNQLIWGWFVFRQTHVDMSFIARVDVFLLCSPHLLTTTSTKCSTILGELLESVEVLLKNTWIPTEIMIWETGNWNNFRIIGPSFISQNQTNELVGHLTR